MAVCVHLFIHPFSGHRWCHRELSAFVSVGEEQFCVSEFGAKIGLHFAGELVENGVRDCIFKDDEASLVEFFYCCLDCVQRGVSGFQIFVGHLDLTVLLLLDLSHVCEGLECGSLLASVRENLLSVALLCEKRC